MGSPGRGPVGRGPVGRWAPLAAAGAALAAAWFATGAPAALYDGLGFPDEPYRYVTPPAGAQPTTAPTAARGTARPGRPLVLTTAEQGPQLVLHLDAGAVPPGTRVVALPVATPAVAPEAGNVVGDVYHVVASDAPPVRAGASLEMRAPGAGQPGPVFEVLTAGGWRPRPTTRVGNDIYETTFTGFGDWALVQVARVTRSGRYDFGTYDSFGPFEAALAIGGPVTVTATVVWGVRSSRVRARRRRGATT